MPNKDDDLKLYDEVIALHKRGGMSEEDAELQAKVDAALDTAVGENGYEEIATWLSPRIALDLIEYNKTFESFSPARLRLFVDDWQKRHGGDKIKVEWATGLAMREVVYVPKRALELAEVQLVAELTKFGNNATTRANANALQSMLLGRQLSICRKALEAMRAVMVEITKLRRFGGDPKVTGNPLDAAADGYLVMQDARALDAAVEAAAKCLMQLEKEHPEAG